MKIIKVIKITIKIHQHYKKNKYNNNNNKFLLNLKFKKMKCKKIIILNKMLKIIIIK